MNLFECLLVALLLAFAPPTPSAPQCPTVVVSCPDEQGTGKHITFTVSVSGGDPSVTPTFKWAVSSGTISGGQGTSSITVDNSNAPASGALTATVEVGGYERSCTTSTGCTLTVCKSPLPRKVEEYGAVSLGDEKERLNHFYTELLNDPTARGYLICYGGRRSRAGEAERRCYRAREYLVATRGLDNSRVVTVDGGLREEPTTEFWLVPTGATPPTASPTVDPAETQAAARPRRGARRGRR